jgi:hypothetical protein
VHSSAQLGRVLADCFLIAIWRYSRYEVVHTPQSYCRLAGNPPRGLEMSEGQDVLAEVGSGAK